MEEEENPIEELSDNWEFVNKLNDKIELFYFLKRLKGKDKKIAILISKGYKISEVMKKLGVGFKRIKDILLKLQE